MAAGGFVYINVTGLKERRRSLVTWGTQIQDLSPAWEEVANDLRGDVLAQFTAQGGVMPGGKWKKLAASTVKDRVRQGYLGPAPILFRTGLLLDATMTKDSPGHIEITTADSMTFGTGLPYASYHQLGTSRMPARRILGLSFNRQSGIIRRLNDYIQQQARWSGLEITGTT